MLCHRPVEASSSQCAGVQSPVRIGGRTPPRSAHAPWAGRAGLTLSVGRRAARPEASYPSRLFPALQTQDHSLKSLRSRAESLLPKMMNADMDAVDAENQVELEEKTRLINQVLELQHTLEDLSARVDAVKEENLKLKSENQVLGQYIENLMSASSVFQTTDTKSKRK